MNSKNITVVQDLMLQYAPKRSVIKNTNNGYAYLTCLILDKNYRVLHFWDKLLQCGQRNNTIHAEVDAY